MTGYTISQVEQVIYLQFLSVTNVHSNAALALPRIEKRRNPIVSLIIPKIGSTVSLRKSYNALPSKASAI